MNAETAIARGRPLQVAKSTLCGWHEKVAELMRPLVEAMRADAFKLPYLCVDATGVLVLAKERCRSGHFWVTVAPDKHVLFAYSKRHDGAAIDELLGGYSRETQQALDANVLRRVLLGLPGGASHRPPELPRQAAVCEG
jgi:hypothetical protein